MLSSLVQVEHFSKYGLPDEDSDAEDAQVAPLKKKVLHAGLQVSI